MFGFWRAVLRLREELGAVHLLLIFWIIASSPEKFSTLIYKSHLGYKISEKLYLVAVIEIIVNLGPYALRHRLYSS